MATAKPRAAAAKTTALPKKDFKESLEELHALSSCLSSFTQQWRELEDHLSSIGHSIDNRLRELESGGGGATSPKSSVMDRPALPVAAEEEPEVEPRPELKKLCLDMDGEGLLAFINDNRKDLVNIYRELNLALRAAPDPATLVLDAMDVFYPAKRSREDTFDGGLHASRRSCICLLEHLHMISPEIGPAVRERAKKLAEEWEVRMTPDAGQNNVEATAFLQLLVSYSLASDFEEDDLLDFLVSTVKRKEAVGLCRNLGLQKRMADIVEKLSSKGKQLDAVKFIYAFGLAEKFPPVPLLKAYVKESKKVAQEMRTIGSGKSQNAAIARELDQLRAVIKTIEEHKLESEYSPEILRKRAAQLEQQKAGKRRFAAGAALTNSKPQSLQQQLNKRPRPSTGMATATATATAAVAAHLLPSLSQTQPQFPLTAGASYLGATGPYDLTGSINLYDRHAAAYKGNLLDQGTMRSSPGSFLYSDPRSGSGLLDRSMAHGSYSLSGGWTRQYSSSLYP